MTFFSSITRKQLVSSSFLCRPICRAHLSHTLCQSNSHFLRPSIVSPLPKVSLSISKNLSLANMASAQESHTQTLEELKDLMKGLGLSEVPQGANTYPELNPFDIYRSHIAELLSGPSGVDKGIIQQSLQWTTTLDKGDLVLPVPALRLKGKKPDELAKELAEKVNCASLASILMQFTDSCSAIVSSFRNHHLSRRLPPLAST
jgi:hypothetical protein